MSTATGRTPATTSPAGRPDSAPHQPILHPTRQLPEEIWRLDDPVQHWRADVARRKHQPAERIGLALQPGAVLVEPAHTRRPHHNLDLGANLVQQRCRLQRALPAADDHHLLAREAAKIAVFG